MKVTSLSIISLLFFSSITQGQEVSPYYTDKKIVTNPL